MKEIWDVNQNEKVIYRADMPPGAVPGRDYWVLAGEVVMTLDEAINIARKNHHMRDGKCSMCASGDEPKNGLHKEKYWCGNNDTCSICHNAGMEYGDKCAACGRIEKLR